MRKAAPQSKEGRTARTCLELNLVVSRLFAGKKEKAESSVSIAVNRLQAIALRNSVVHIAVQAR